MSNANSQLLVSLILTRCSIFLALSQTELKLINDIQIKHYAYVTSTTMLLLYGFVIKINALVPSVSMHVNTLLKEYDIK